MSFMRWLRGGGEDTTATAMLSAGLAEIAGIFQPTRHKQTEHVEEMKNRRVDIGNSADVDLDRGIVVIRRTRPQPPDGAANRTETPGHAGTGDRVEALGRPDAADPIS